MPFQMSYTPPFSETAFPNSYWVCTNVSFNPSTLAGSLQFQGWDSEADYAAGLPPIPDAQYSYSLTPALMTAYLTESNQSLASLLNIVYGYAQYTQDYNGASFFANATIVS